MFALRIAVAVGLGLALPAACWSQNTTITSPSSRPSHSFFEQNGVGFGFNVGGGAPVNRGGGSGVVGLMPNGQFTPDGSLQFRQNNQAVPPFGGFEADAGGMGGISMSNGNASALLNFLGNQGSSRSNTSISPSVTVGNGATGYVSESTQRPFVTGVVPVVGGFGGGGGGVGFSLPAPLPGGLPAGATPLDERLGRLESGEKVGARGSVPAGGAATKTTLPKTIRPIAQDDDALTKRLDSTRASTAGRGAASLEEIRAAQLSRQNGQQREAASDFERGQQAENSGKPAVAKMFYEMAARKASGQLKDSAVARASALGRPNAGLVRGPRAAASATENGPRTISSARQTQPGPNLFPAPNTDLRRSR